MLLKLAAVRQLSRVTSAPKLNGFEIHRKQMLYFVASEYLVLKWTFLFTLCMLGNFAWFFVI